MTALEEASTWMRRKAEESDVVKVEKACSFQARSLGDETHEGLPFRCQKEV